MARATLALIRRTAVTAAVLALGGCSAILGHRNAMREFSIDPARLGPADTIVRADSGAACVQPHRERHAWTAVAVAACAVGDGDALRYALRVRYVADREEIPPQFQQATPVTFTLPDHSQIALTAPRAGYVAGTYDFTESVVIPIPAPDLARLAAAGRADGMLGRVPVTLTGAELAALAKVLR